MKPFRKLMLACNLKIAFAVVGLSIGHSSMFAQETVREGDWTFIAPGEMVMELQLTPCPEAKPALKHRFIPSTFDQVQGNAAVFYLRALGFIEQTAAREEVSKILRKAAAEAVSQGKSEGEVGPDSWLELAPGELPIREVKEYLRLHSFQPRDLAEAAKRSYFSMERNIRLVENPVGVLLPEIQTMRHLARLQRLRCRVAIAEGELDKAQEILGQQFAMARHLGDDAFIVSYLVGAAIQGIAMEDLFQYLRHPKSSNMYWALQLLPSPTVSFEEAIDFEYNFLFEQIKPLREVSEEVKEPGYWSDFVDRVLPSMISLQLLDGVESNPTKRDLFQNRIALTTLIASSYLSAKQYLADEWKLDPGLLERMPTAQVVFLAMRRFYEMQRDEFFKWASLPYSHSRDIDPEAATKIQTKKWGWFTAPGSALTPGIPRVVQVQARMQQQIVMAQVIESIRDYSASNSGRLPARLSDLRLPVRNDPVNDQPFDYKLDGNKATLSGSRTSNVQYRLNISIRP